MPHDENDDPIDRETTVEERRRMLANTVAFLEGVRDEDATTGPYIEELKAALENDLRRLERERPGGEHGDQNY